MKKPATTVDVRAGLVATPVRLVLGWLFFSALWRRAVLDPSKLDVHAAGSLAEKTNHFLPHAIDPGGLLEWALRHPDALTWGLWGVSIAEGAVGALLLAGWLTRAAALGVGGLSAAILASAGWLGTTCLDEWQIGALGIAGAALLALSGAGPVSLDAWLSARHPEASARWGWLGSAPLSVRSLRRLGLGAAVASLLITLGTNQWFHGGLVGPLHNLSAKPHVRIEHAQLGDGELDLRLMRTEGPDTHGAFIVAIDLLNDAGDVIEHLDAAALSALDPARIHNRYIAQVRPGPHGLVLPLGALAALRIPLPRPAAEATQVRLREVSGLAFDAPLSAAQCTLAHLARNAPRGPVGPVTIWKASQLGRCRHNLAAMGDVRSCRNALGSRSCRAQEVHTSSRPHAVPQPRQGVL